MNKISIVLDVQKMRDDANAASTEYHTEQCRTLINLPALELSLELYNVPEDLSKELREAQQAIYGIDSLKRDRESMERRLNATLEQFSLYRQRHPADPKEVREAAIPHLLDGQKINAIKAVRELTQWGLKESKEYCDTLQAEIIPNSQ